LDGDIFCVVSYASFVIVQNDKGRFLFQEFTQL